MIITSPSFENGAAIPKKFTCDGGDINPEFQIQNVPAGTESLALMVHDPDAPITEGFTHWLVWNIDPRTVLIKEESVPPGASEGANGAGAVRYMGPCPSHGPVMHHYHFRLFALDAPLGLSEGADRAAFVSAITGHILAESELVGTYARG
jgi:Raf kinase inhibitor-like YbhB/YbcL family protein